MRNMVTPTEALQIVLDTSSVLPTETVAHREALGRTLARDIVSELELPPFPNSAMDGYAVVAADLQTATEQQPVTLRVLETIAAGAVPQLAVVSGACSKIMTGARVPEGADAVVMREETREQGSEVAILTSARTGQSIRPTGDDVRRGETVLTAGTFVRPAEWAMLASLNQAQVEVGRRPRVGIVATGEELVDIGVELKDGQIVDSNSFSLQGLCGTAGALVTDVLRVGDSPATLEAALIELAERCDVIVTSGGVSVGDFDPVRDVLQKIADVHFWKIAMKPGKPVMFATLKKSDGATVLVFGLPGNPVSVMVSFEQFVRPALLKLQGRRAVERLTVQARVDSTVRSPADKVEFIRALVVPDGNGWRAVLTGDQSSGRLSTMTRANALLIVPVGVDRVEAGDLLEAQMTEWPEGESRQ